MAGSSPREAFETFVTPFRTAVSLIVPEGRGVIVRSPGRLLPETDLWISFAGAEPVRLAGTGLYLKLIHNFRIEVATQDRRPYSMATTGYWYSLLDGNGRELIAYHYHPSAIGWCKYPHLHAGAAREMISGKAHLITELVSFAAFVRMLIEDPAFPVVWLRPGWERVLDSEGGRDGAE